MPFWLQAVFGPEWCSKYTKITVLTEPQLRLTTELCFGNAIAKPAQVLYCNLSRMQGAFADCLVFAASFFGTLAKNESAAAVSLAARGSGRWPLSDPARAERGCSPDFRQHRCLLG